jgi:hypothetical protein
MAVYKGEYVDIDYGDMPWDDALEEALASLDEECRTGCGGTWDIYESREPGVVYEAAFIDFATDTLYYDGESWSVGSDSDGDADDEDEDESPGAVAL